MTTTAGAAAHFAEQLNVVRERAAGLGDGPVRLALSEEFLAGIEARLDGELSGWSTWPPLFVYSARSALGQLEALDAAIQAVTDQTRPAKQAATHGWLLAKDGGGGVRQWRSGLFELAVKSRFLAAATDVEFDAVLENGRDVDVRATVAGRSMCFEATIISESDEDQGVWARFMAAKGHDEASVLVRPGEHDPENAKGPSPYYDTSRVYLKIYDKLAKEFDPAKPQLSDDEPNVIMLSVWTGYGMPYTSSPGIAWALDELFADQPKGAAKEMTRPGLTDVSLRHFLDGVAPQRVLELLQSPRRVSAVSLFNETAYANGRINYNARTAHQLSHAEMAAVEAIAAVPLPWT